MDKNKIKILIIMFITVVALFMLWFMFLRNYSPATPSHRDSEPAIQTETQIQEENNTVKLQPRPEKDITPVDYTEEDLKMMAFSFAERLGSYSNQASFANILELKIFMTSSMQDWADDYVAKMRKDSQYSGVYEGVSTRALTGTVREFDSEAGTAEILVHTQKTKTDADDKEEVVREDLIVRYVLTNKEWLVDYAKWE